MTGFLVSDGGGGVAVYFNQDEARGIVELLDDVEPRDAGLAHTGLRIRERGRFERIDVLRFDVNVYMNDEHERRGEMTRERCARQSVFEIRNCVARALQRE